MSLSNYTTTILDVTMAITATLAPLIVATLMVLVVITAYRVIKLGGNK